MGDNFSHIIGYGITLLIVWWIIKNPAAFKRLGNARTFQYVLHAILGVGFGAVVGGIISLFFHSPELLIRLVLAYSPVVIGAGIGIYIAHKRPASLVLSSSEEKALTTIAETLKESDK